ncbi:MAG: shikimate kinase [Pseudomonadota bacterium]
MNRGEPQDQTGSPVARTIVLVGMMGVGKTTVGRRLAPRLGLPFKDADQEIEAASGMSVGDLFEAHGEESFRAGEAQVIRRLVTGPPIVLATGGGAFVNESTRQVVKDHAVSVWLRADVDTIVQRATRRPTRPLLKNGDPKQIISRLLKEREVFYSQADLSVDSAKGPHARTVEKIVDAIAAYTKVELA